MRMHWQPDHEGSGRKVRTNVLAGELAGVACIAMRKDGRRELVDKETCSAPNSFGPVPVRIKVGGADRRGRLRNEHDACPFEQFHNYLLMIGEDETLRRRKMRGLTFVVSVVIASDFTTHLLPGYEGDKRTPVR